MPHRTAGCGKSSLRPLMAGSSPSLPDGSNPSAAIVQSASDVQCSRLLKTTEKLDIISEYKSILGIASAEGWQTIEPDEFGDWLNQRDPFFDKYIVLGEKKTDETKVFDNFSLGVASGRDAWAYNPSKDKLKHNMESMIAFYNDEVERFNSAHPVLTKKERESLVGGFIDNTPSKISWTRALKQELAKNNTFTFEETCLTTSLYRPFTKRWMYFNRKFNEMVYQMPKIFPDAGMDNLVIMVTAKSAKEFSHFISSVVPDLNSMEAGAQCFPLYLYEAKEDISNDLFATGSGSGYERKDAMTDEALDHFQSAYPDNSISKEDIFYYIYGLLHSEDYRERYADNLSKQLPRIPRVESYDDFAAFSQAGRDLADLHLNYETSDLNTQVSLASSVKYLRVMPQGVFGGESSDFRVTKMKFAKKDDKTRVVYNNKITIENIPVEAYDYVVNGKPALEWVMERQSVTTDKDSGIVNDANDWAIETIKNARYPLELFLRVINVSLKTQEIVRGLPRLKILNTY
ncbi:hypothetical protein VCSRO84_3609 [Vibrio cholerae]|uniref:type ISP restriction/modification enzyme n=2 Tax=Vibrio cholerae TaxID=666 RepID=UPI0012F6A240|nr:type ISP restriction/modification enzyme [Vibrio cholerae]GIA22265.1 hypothetical protein VCSRO84_3609 [Vibrio cholerae]